jgi:4-hydroxy-tetrahydrodipicolinate synthase
MRPAIELVTGIKVGPARSPLAPITEDEKKVLIDTLKSVGKLK